jgi:hypothetical protein
MTTIEEIRWPRCRPKAQSHNICNRPPYLQPFTLWYVHPIENVMSACNYKDSEKPYHRARTGFDWAEEQKLNSCGVYNAATINVHVTSFHSSLPLSLQNLRHSRDPVKIFRINGKLPQYKQNIPSYPLIFIHERQGYEAGSSWMRRRVRRALLKEILLKFSTY